MNTSENTIVTYAPLYEELFDKFKEDLPNCEEINILYIGVSIQSQILKPYFKALNTSKINCINIYRAINLASINIEKYEGENLNDSTLFTIDYLKDVEGEETYSFDNANDSLSLDKNGKIKFKIIEGIPVDDIFKNHNILNFDNYFNFHGLQFDVIFCLFELHYSLNWRYATNNLLKVLKPKGALYFSELNDSISILDGMFPSKLNKEIDDEIKSLFFEFFSKRNAIYYYAPEISTSNYRELQKFLTNKFIQFNITNFKKLSIQINRNIIHNLIDNEILNYFKVGLNDIDKKNLKEIFTNFSFCNLHYKLTLFKYENLKEPFINDQIKLTDRSSISLVQYLNNLKDFQIDKIGIQFLQMLKFHDYFIPRITEYIGLYMPAEYYNGESNFLRAYGEKGEIEVSEILRSANIDKIDGKNYTPSYLLFDKLEIQTPVFIAFCDFDGFRKLKMLIKTLDGKLEINDGKKIIYLYIKIIKNKKGIQKSVYFIFSEYEDDSVVKYETIEDRFNQSINFNVLLDLNTIAQLYNSIVSSFIQSSKNDDPFNFQINYFPSFINESKLKDHANLNYLGNIFMFEKLYSENDEIYKLIQDRNKLLARIANYLFHKAGLVHYVNQDFKRHARRAAIAAITARNISHNIGSHVFPNFISNDNYDSGDYKILLEYLKQRNDLNTLLAAIAPKWTASCLFHSDLLYGFMNQRILLENIGKNEGINEIQINTYKREYRPFVGKNKNLHASKYLGTRTCLDLSHRTMETESVIIEKLNNEAITEVFAIVTSKENCSIDVFSYCCSIKLILINKPDEIQKIKIGDRIIFKISNDHKKHFFKCLNNNIKKITLDQIQILEYSVNIKCLQELKDYENPNKIKDINIGIPGGIIGYQAFYTILENLIRNILKHDKAPASSKLLLNVEISEIINKKYYILKIWSKSSVLDAGNRINLPKKLNKIFEEDIIEKDGRSKDRNLGLHEMKINSLFLSDYGGELVDNLTEPSILDEKMPKNIPFDSKDGVIRASCIFDFDERDEKIKTYLGFKFIIQKCKDLLIISNDKIFSKLNSERIRVVNEEESIRLEKSKQTNYTICVVDICDTHSLESILHKINEIDNTNIDEFRYSKLRYPYRFIVLYEGPESAKDFIHSKFKSELIKTVSKRCFFLQKKKFVNILSRSEDYIINQLYAYWISIYYTDIPQFNMTLNDLNKAYQDKEFENEKLHPTLSKKRNNNKIIPVFQKKFIDSLFLRSKSKKGLSIYNFNILRHKMDKSMDNKIFYTTSGFHSSIELIRNSQRNIFSSLQIIESLSTKVLIIDERITDFFINLDNAEVREYFYGIGIIIPTQIIIKGWKNYGADLNINEMDVLKDKIKINLYDEQQTEFSTLIIHQMLLDKVVEQSIGPEIDRIQATKTVIDHLKDNFNSVLVCSGKNITSEYSSLIKHLHFDVLQEYIIREIPDKISFIQNILNTQK